MLAGKHVFVEKPLATSVAEVDELGRLSAERDLLVMAGHTFVYNAAVRYVKKLLDAGEVGEIRYIYSQRLNLGRIRSDIDALWNFAPHDVSIIQYWLGDPLPVSVQRIGMDFIQKGIDDVVFLSLVYPKKIIANIHVSWLDPQKVRKIIIVGSRKMIVFDDVAEDKVTIYDKGIDRKAILGENMDFDQPNVDQFNYRNGDSIIPQIHFTEPVRCAAESFVQSMWNGKKSLTGIAHARNVVAILERARECKPWRIVETRPTEPAIRKAGIVDVNFGTGITLVEPVNLYGCSIGNDCFIGPFVEIQRGVIVGKRCRIQSHAFICELVSIGDDCFISHGAMFINDLFTIGGPAKGRRDLWCSTKIGNGVSIGTNATILPVSICDRVVVGAGAVVTKDITEPGIYAGNPARLRRPL